MPRKLLLLVLLAAIIGGCAIHPDPIKTEETKDRVEEDLTRMYENQEPLSGPLTLWEAMARGLKYNLDHRVKLMENVLSERILGSARYDMLPDLAANAGYTWRNNYPGGDSMSLDSGEITLGNSTSQEKRYMDANLSLVWNILDFGVSYAVAKQKANDILITRERRRRVIQNILSDIREAYWEAVAAEKLLHKIDALLKETRGALEQSRTLESSATQNPETALRYQKRLITSIRQLSRLQEEMILAKTRLAALINIPLSHDYEVAIPSEAETLPDLQIDLRELEYLALMIQPEVREEDYTVRNKHWEVKKAVSRMLPGIEISLRQDYNDNKFLRYQQWYTASLRISWNIFSIFSGPAAIREAKAHITLGEHRRMALSKAIMTQVWVAYLRYQLAVKDFSYADDLNAVNVKLSDLAGKAQRAHTRGRMDVTLTHVDGFASLMSRELAYAGLQNALGKVYHSVGLDPLPGKLIEEEPYSFSNYSVEALTDLIRNYRAKGFKDYLQEIAGEVPQELVKEKL